MGDSHSGAGGVIHADPNSGSRKTVIQLPGFTRGWALRAGMRSLDSPRSAPHRRSDGVPMADRRAELKCGIAAIDLDLGKLIGLLEFQTAVEEIFDCNYCRASAFLKLSDSKKRKSITHLLSHRLHCEGALAA
jgi:hypothetical protein